jgi:hypothetical protein
VAESVPGLHAEEALINAAGNLGLTPTVGVSTNLVCPGCAAMIEELGVQLAADSLVSRGGITLAATSVIVMTEYDLLIAIRRRVADSSKRIDLKSAGIPAVYGTATENALHAAEAELGFALPSLLRKIYSEVENGGFGPGAGLIGVENGYTDPDGRTISHLYLALRTRGLPPNVLPLCDLGDGAWSCVDMRSPGDNLLTANVDGITLTRFTMSSWLGAWVSGVDIESEIFETTSNTIVNPFTRKPHAVKQRGRAKGTLLQPFQL